MSEGKRRFVRFEPDVGDYAQIDKNPDDGDFKVDSIALIVDEAPYGGCSLVCLKNAGMEKGAVHRFKIGKLSPLRAEIVWLREVDDKVVRIGLRFLE